MTTKTFSFDCERVFHQSEAPVITVEPAGSASSVPSNLLIFKCDNYSEFWQFCKNCYISFFKFFNIVSSYFSICATSFIPFVCRDIEKLACLSDEYDVLGKVTFVKAK